MVCCCSHKEIKKSDYFGANEDRKCRDVFWLLIFVLFIVGMFVIAILGFVNGDIKRFYYGTDMYGNICGSDNKYTKYRDPNPKRLDLTNKKYVYFPNPLNLTINYCIEKCPTYDDIPNYAQQVQAAVLGGSTENMTMTCLYDANSTDIAANLGTSCWPQYPSFDIVHRCLPDVTNTTLIDSMFSVLFGATTNGTSTSTFASSLISILNKRSGFTKAIADVATMWWLLLASIGFACIVAFIWLGLIKFLVKPIVYIMLAIAQFGLIALTIYFWRVADDMNDELNGAKATYRLDDDATQQLAIRILAYICLGASILVFVLLVFLRKRIKLAIGVIREASQALKTNFCISFFPLVQYVIYACILAYWIVVTLFLASAYKTSSTGTVDVNYGGYEPNISLQYMFIYHAFGGIWLLFFFSGVGKTTIAGVIAAWYWLKETDDRSKKLSATRSFFRTLRYSAGSIALGSLLMATIRFIRILFEYFARLKARAAKKNIPWLSCLLKIVSCCIWCFEKIIKFITESTYIMIAIAGKSFCKSAAHVLSLQANNWIRILVLKGIAGFALFMTRFAIAIFTALAAAIICRYKGTVEVSTSFYTATSLHYWYVPVILCFLFAWIVAGLFTNVYDVAINTVMLSFCEDETLPGAAHNDKLAALMNKKDSASANYDSSSHKSNSTAPHKEITN